MTSPKSTPHGPKRGGLHHFSYSTKRSSCIIAAFVSLFLLLLLLQVETLKSSISPSWPLFPQESSPCPAAMAELNRTRAILRDLIAFLPLKDAASAGDDGPGNTWFMSSLNNSLSGGYSPHLHLPSPASDGRLLCLSAHDVSKGTKNSYALAWREALPPGATLLPGLTFISETYYNHVNLWHGLSALLPFVSWYESNRCAVPARWVLFHWGELRKRMGDWVKVLAEATFGEVPIEDLSGYGGGPACFEEAVVFRREGGLSKARRGEVYDMIRCKSRAHCGVTGAGEEVGDREAAVRMTLLLRLGRRSFKNESEVIRIFEGECEKVGGCRAKVAWGHNVTFCDQVRLMSETDVLISPHGGQLTNLFLMDRGSSVMEMYPKGWKELAGQGQFVYRWMADWSGMRHKGSWRDEEGEECGETDRLKCFSFHKNKQIGHDEDYFRRWAAEVLAEAKQLKSSSVEGKRNATAPCACSNLLH